MKNLWQKCRKIKHVALDMDGTIYLGSKLFPFTLGFLKDLEDMGIKYSFLTNNPTKSVADYLLKIEKLGIKATPEEMYTSSVAAIDYLRDKMPEAGNSMLVGTPVWKKNSVMPDSNSCRTIPTETGLPRCRV